MASKHTSVSHIAAAENYITTDQCCPMLIQLRKDSALFSWSLVLQLLNINMKKLRLCSVFHTQHTRQNVAGVSSLQCSDTAG